MISSTPKHQIFGNLIPVLRLLPVVALSSPGEDLVGLHQKGLVGLADESILLKRANELAESPGRSDVPRSLPQRACDHTIVGSNEIFSELGQIKGTEGGSSVEQVPRLRMRGDVVLDERPSAFSHLVHEAANHPLNTDDPNKLEFVRVRENDCGASLLAASVEGAKLGAVVIQNGRVDVFLEHHELISVPIGDANSAVV